MKKRKRGENKTQAIDSGQLLSTPIRGNGGG
jgi:hypothetical protein